MIKWLVMLLVSFLLPIFPDSGLGGGAGAAETTVYKLTAAAIIVLQWLSGIGLAIASFSVAIDAIALFRLRGKTIVS